MFAHRTGLLSMEDAQTIEKIDGQINALAPLSEADITRLIEGDRKEFAGADITIGELSLCCRQFDSEAERLHLDLQSVFSAWQALNLGRPADLKANIQTAQRFFPKFKDLYDISFEDASTDVSGLGERKEADSGFVTGVKNIWNKFIEMLKNIWKKLKELLFGTKDEEAKDLSRTAENAAKEAGDRANELMNQDITEIRMDKAKICAHLSKEATADQVSMVLDEYIKGLESCILIIKAYEATSEKVKKEFTAKIAEDFDPATMKKNILEALMHDLKKAAPGKPEAASVQEAIKVSVGVDLVAIDSNKWAYVDMGLQGIAMLFSVTAMGEVPKGSRVSAGLNEDPVLIISVSKYEEIAKKVALAASKWSSARQEAQKILQAISHNEAAATDNFKNINTANAKAIKDVMNESFNILKGTPGMATCVVSSMDSVGAALKSFQSDLTKAIEKMKQEKKKVTKDKAKEDKAKGQTPEDKK